MTPPALRAVEWIVGERSLAEALREPFPRPGSSAGAISGQRPKMVVASFCRPYSVVGVHRAASSASFALATDGLGSAVPGFDSEAFCFILLCVAWSSAPRAPRIPCFAGQVIPWAPRRGALRRRMRLPRRLASLLHGCTPQRGGWMLGAGRRCSLPRRTGVARYDCCRFSAIVLRVCGRVLGHRVTWISSDSSATSFRFRRSASRSDTWQSHSRQLGR